MKLPRWLVVSLLSASTIAVLGACAWWWVTWPDRTLQKFVAFMQIQDFDEVNALMQCPARWGNCDSKVLTHVEPNPWMPPDAVDLDVEYLDVEIRLDFCGAGRLLGDRDLLKSWFTSRLQAEAPSFVDFALARRRFLVADRALQLVVVRGQVDVPQPNPSILIRVAQEQFDAGQFDRAVILFDCARAIEPDNHSALAGSYKARIEGQLQLQERYENRARFATVAQGEHD
jgi:hypothetical protein